MKARYSNIFLCIVMLLFVACMGVEESPVPGDYSAPQLTLNDVSQLESSFVIELSATVNYLSDNEGLKDCGFLYSVDPDFQTPNLISLGTKGGISFSATLMLDDFGQKYYFKAYITNGIDEIMSDVKSFIVPDFDTHVHFGGVSVDSYTENTARVSFTANVDNGIKEIERGIELSDNQSFGNARQFVDNQNVNGRGSVLLSELTPGRKYYIRPYVTYKATIVYGEISGLMVYAIPTLKTSQVTLIESDRAVCGATGIDDFGSEIVEKGLVWSKSGNPTVERDSKTVNGSGQADFSAVMTGLEPGTQYYVRAYATNGEGTGYGEQRSFSTAKALPVVRTVQMDNVTANSASVSCSLVSTGGDAIKERGIVWSTHSSPTMGDNKQVDKGTKDTYTLSLNGLEVATQYYVRAYAVNSIGTAYGEELSFTTGKTVPVVSTDQISDISYTTAVCGGDISFDGGTEVTERGVVWGTSQNPVIYAGNSTRDGKGTGRYSSHISGLQPGKTYYVRAYARNEMGIAYGEQRSFTTKSFELPAVETLDVSSITSSSAKAGGNVTFDGGTNVTDRGVVWSTSHNPTVSLSTKTHNGNGTGEFAGSITGLEFATRYYVRAYATNSVGTVYGAERSFITQAVVPTVTTASVIIDGKSVTLGGNVTATGGADVVERGVVWSTNDNPTITDNKKILGEGAGSFSTTISNLSPDSRYYVRAYAINSVGISYGEQIEFLMYALPTAVYLNLSDTVALYKDESVTPKPTVYPKEAPNKTLLWSTSNSSIATVSADGRITAVGHGSATIVVWSEVSPDVRDSVVIRVKEHVESVELEPATASLYEGETLSLDAKIYPSDADDRELLYSSEDEETATVDPDGTVHAVRAGTTTITVTSHDGEKTAQCEVTVLCHLESISFEKSEMVGFINDKIQLAPIFYPERTTDSKSLTWESSDSDVAMVNSKGIVVLLATGNATITATSVENPEIKAELSVTVIAKSDKVTLNRYSAELYEGETITLEATVSPYNDPSLVKWISNNPSAATVSAEGVVTAVSGGTAVIRAQATDNEAHYAECTVTVKSHVTGVSITKKTDAISLGGSYQFEAKVSPDNAGNKAVTWSSSNPDVISIDKSSGLAKANSSSEEPVTITVTTVDGGFPASCVVTVKPYIDKVDILYDGKTVTGGETLILYRGDVIPLQTKVIPEGVNDNVTWTSSKTGVVGIENGKLSIKGVGTAVRLTATTEASKSDGTHATAAVTVNVCNHVETVSLVEKVEMREGETKVLTPTFTPFFADERISGWESSDKSVATVSSDGTVKAVKSGTAVITVTALDGGKTATCTVTVAEPIIPIRSISFSRDSEELGIGMDAFMTSKQVTISPSDASIKELHWEVSDASVVKFVLDDGTLVSTVDTDKSVHYKAVGAGLATLRATAKDGSGKTATCTVTVISLQLPGVSTSSPSAVSISSATVGGNVSSDGGASVTERGVVWSTYSSPTLSDNRKAVGSGTGSFSTTLTGLKASTKYYVRAYAINSVGTAYGSSYSFTTTADGGTESVGNDDYDWGDIGGNSTHEYVDLGLSVKWATCNIGASKPEEYGDYFAWGATEPLYQPGYAQSTSPVWKSGKSGGYNWVNAPYQTVNTTSYSSTKWTKYLGSTSSSYRDPSATNSDALKTVLDPEDDAAHVNWGGAWRMPTHGEQEELLNNCTWTWTTINGIKGYMVQSNKSGYTDRWIFLPAAGYRFDTYLGFVGSSGYYWSSSLYTDGPYRAYYLYFDSGSCSTYNYGYRASGRSVRPVCH